MPAKPTIAIIGPGRLGTALALQLAQSRISRFGDHFADSGIRTQGPRPRPNAEGPLIPLPQTPNLDAGLIWLSVPDREIAVVAADLAVRDIWRGKTVFHSSGALGSDSLAAVRKRGANVASVHPHDDVCA